MKIIWRNVKYPRIDLRDGDVVVIAPPGTDIQMLLEKKKGWIDKNLRLVKELKRKAEEDIAKHGIRILDRYMDMRHNCKNPGIHGNTVYICKKRNDLLKRQLKNMLREDLNARVMKFSKILEIEPNRIYIREQKTKWGSCSSLGNLSFNLLLVFLPEHFRDYVVAHEITHLLYRNHGEKFKETLSRLNVRIPTKDDILFMWYYSTLCAQKLYIKK